MKIHHATLKKAAKLGVTLKETENAQFVASHPDLDNVMVGQTARDALDLIALDLGAKGAKESVARKVRAKSAPAKGTPKKKASGKKAKVAKAAVPSNRSVVKKVYKDRYAKQGGTSGTPIAKALSDALLGEGPGVLPKIAKENGIEWIYAALDTGRQRMCLGTILKGKDRRGEVVRVLGKKVANPVEDEEGEE